MDIFIYHYWYFASGYIFGCKGFVFSSDCFVGTIVYIGSGFTFGYLSFLEKVASLLVWVGFTCIVWMSSSKPWRLELI